MRYTTVLQGECRVTSDPDAILTTVLGSCVAVCLHDPKASVGGMNHFLLPGEGSQNSKDLRYGIHSMELLINELLKIGASRKRLVARLYGGASVIKNKANIGRSNVEFANEFLKNESIPAIEKNVGGGLARRVKFQASTGRVKLVVVEEAAPFAQTPKAPKVKPEVTLF
ncbi:MAG: chemotaxis protein CheD [Pseudomonadota bacterium]